MPELDAKQRLDGEKGDVFVSWTSKDEELKDKVVKYLKGMNLKCLDSGESCCGNFVEWSKSTAKDASVFMLILTENTVDKILKDKQNNKSNYVLEEVHTVLKEWGADAINRIIVICPNDEVYNHPALWEDLQGSSEGNLLRKGHLSVIYYGTELTDSKLEEIFRKVTNLLIHRFIHKYNDTIMSTNYIKLVPFYKDKHLQKSSDEPYPFDDLYVPRTITEIGANGEVLAELDSPKELVACGDILFLSGSGGSGKTQYLMQLFKSVGDDTVMISLPCFKIANSEKPLFKDMYDYFYEKCGHKDFYSEENFRKLIYAKKLLLVLDGVDEIPTEASVRKFLEKIGAFYESDNKNVTLFFTGRNEKDAEYITFREKTVRKFRLNQLSDEGIKKLGNNLFLMFGNEDKGNEFYVRVKDLDDEIKSNPLLLSQLAIVYNDSGVVPQTIVGIFDAVSAIMLKRDKFKDIEIPQEYQKIVNNVSYWLAAFAAERYSCISRGKTVTALTMLKKLLKPYCDEFDYESCAEFLLEYIRSRAIYIEDNDGNGEFYHKMFSEYFTAVHYYKRAFDDYSEIEDRFVISELFGHYSDSYWAKVLQLFLIKADSCIDKATTDELYKLILSENQIEEYTLLFDCCRDLIVHKQEAQTVLVCDILQKSADGVYPPYGPLFWYVPEYGLYETALFAASYLKGNAKALALVRDICYIYGQKNSVNAITDQISGQELFDAASPNLSGVRRALCEIFYLGDTKYEGGKDIYPRCFNVAETLSFRDCGCGLFGRMKTSFQDELGLYSHTSYNILKGGAIGLVSCPYDAAEIEKRLSGMESFKLRGLIFSPTEEERFEAVNFTRINVQVLYLPENIIKIDERFFQYMPLICDVYANKGGVRYLFGDVKLLPLYPEMNFSGCRTVKSVVIAEGVNEIGNFAFRGCSSLQAIEIPKGVEEIENSAFKYCSSLQKVKIPEGVKVIRASVFASCSSLRAIEIPKGVEEIEDSAFKDCSSLQKVKIPEGVKVIRASVFAGCSSLQTIEISEGVEEIENSAFKDCSSLQKVKIPEGVKVIRASVFAGCSSLQAIEIPKGVEEIENSAFKDCSSLQKVKTPEGVKVIRASVFAGCSSLQTIEISEGVEEIENSAFKDCSSLQKVKIPEGVKVIRASVFAGCSSLQTIEIPKGVEEIENSAFKGCSSLQKVKIPEGVKVIRASVFAGCSSLQAIEMPEGVREIGHFAFEGCCSVQKIEIAEGVREIGYFAFKGCSSLKKITLSDVFEPIVDMLGLDYDVVNIEYVSGSSSDVFFIKDGTEEIPEEMFKDSLASQLVIPSSVKKIGARAFLGCRRLKTIEIPEGVRAIGDSAFEGCSSLREIKIPEGEREIGRDAFRGCSNLQKVKIPEGVEEIKSGAFEGCSSLREVKIAEGVREIGRDAFRSCSSLREIKIPEGVREIGHFAFEGCCSVQKIEIPEGVREIGRDAFRGCSSLQEIKIPEGIEEIMNSVFKGCSSLQSIEIPKGVEKIWNSAFVGCSSLQKVKIPEGVRIIEDSAFKDCSSLQSIEIPKGVETIWDSAFAGCSSLQKVKIPEGVRIIEDSVFKNCSSLQSIEIPKGVETIWDSAFAGCSNLQKVKIPEEVREIGYSAFYGCSSLQSIEIPKGVGKIGDSAFAGCSSLQKVKIPEGVREIGYSVFYGCSSLQEVKIPEGVKAIRSGAFEGCSSLQKIEIPEGVKEIGSGAFEGCSRLHSIEISEGVEEIPGGAFKGCSGLQKIEIPEGVEVIGRSAFEGCSGLQVIEIPEGVKEIGSAAFLDCSSLKEIVIPRSVLDIGDNAFKDCTDLESVTIGINFKNDIQRIFGEIDSKIMHFI